MGPVSDDGLNGLKGFPLVETNEPLEMRCTFFTFFFTPHEVSDIIGRFGAERFEGVLFVIRPIVESPTPILRDRIRHLDE